MSRKLVLAIVLIFVLISMSGVVLKLHIVYASPYKDIDVHTAHNMITNGSYPDLVVLDVRTQGEYDDGHIYNAVWIPVTELEARIGQLAIHKDHEIIVYCWSGGRSVTASGILDSHNFTKVHNMLGGIEAWQSTGYPVWIATVHNINTTFNYDTIQAAIDANETLDGHTIFVEEGIYYENVVLNKPNLTLMGENKHVTVIDGGGATVVSLKTNNTKIKEFTVQNGQYGILMSPWTYGHIVNSNIILNNRHGISGHYDCANVSICDNIITLNDLSGIWMLFSHSMVSNNLISDNGRGEYLEYSSGIQIVKGVLDSEINYCVNNTISSNTVKNHRIGIWALQYSEENLFFHNNFVNNTKQFYVPAITWNNSIIENYWSDYDGTDVNSDGIGDTPYKIHGNVQDKCPLMGMSYDFSTTSNFHVNIISNSTIEDFEYFESNSTIRMVVSNMTANQTFGFCRARIPHGLMNETYHVTVNGTEPFYVNYTLYDDGDNRWIYLSYEHSTLEIIIIPEFPSFLILPLFMIATLLGVMAYRRKHAN